MSDTAAGDPASTRHAARSTTWPLVAICVGYFMVILDTTVVNVALPALSRGLHTSTTRLQWVVDGYSLAFAALLLSGVALLGTLVAQQRHLIVGLHLDMAIAGAAFLLGSILSIWSI